MPTKRQPCLLTLPIELIHRIFDYVDAETIIFVIRHVCKQLYTITKTYNRYELDFRFMFRYDLSLLARIIDPKNVISLILSNELQTNDQINYFFSQFPIEQFIRLHSLTLINVEEELAVFQKHIVRCPLRKFSIILKFDDITDSDIWLSSIISNVHLQKLEISTSSWLLRSIQWSIECQLEHLTISHKCDWITIKSILTCLPCLRVLTLKDFLLDNLCETTFTQYNSLTSLSLNSSRLEIQNVETFLSLFPGLEHLQLINNRDFSDPTLFDGSRLENFIETKLPLLNKFEFWFSNYLQYGSKDITVETLIASFQSLFWLEVKHWIVKCDFGRQKDLEVVHLYSIPICRNDFDYGSQHVRIKCSALNITPESGIIMVKSNRLSIDLSEMTIENVQKRTNIRTNYLFENVTELILKIENKWPISSIEQLLRIVSLSYLKTLRLNFNRECEFIGIVTTEIHNLLNKARNLRTVEINYNNCVKTMSKTLNTICWKLPDHIRRLEIDIANVDDGKQILERAEHLSSITFRPHKGSYLNNEIIELITQMGNNTHYKLQPDISDERIDPYDDCTIHIWLGRNTKMQSNLLTKTQSNLLTKPTRGKNVFNCLPS